MPETNDKLGLHHLADTDLERVLRLLYKDQIAAPVQLGGLVLAQLGHVEEHLGAILGHTKVAAIAIIATALNERRAARKAQAELLWSGPAGTGAGTREPFEGLQALIATAERSVLWTGVDLPRDARLLRSLHAAQRGRGLQVSLVLVLRDGDERVSQLVAAARDADEIFRQAGERPAIFVPVEPLLAAALPRCILVDDERITLLAGAHVEVEPDERSVTFGVTVSEARLAHTLTLTWQRLIDHGVLAPL